MSDYVEEYDHERDLDEIVFENRNKAYGAYDLRKSYRSILTKAFIIGVVLFSLGIVIPFTVMKIKQMNPVKEEKVDITLMNLDEEEPEEDVIIEEDKPDEPPPPPPPKEEVEEIEVIKNVVPEPKKDPPVETPPPPVEIQKTTTTGIESREGVKKPNATPPPPPPPPNTGVGKAVDAKPQVSTTTVYEKVEQEAEFPGGLNAFRQYVGEEFDRDIVEDLDDKVTTTLTFVVERDGSITDVKATGGPAEFREEAIRTVKSIRRKWTPAKIDGKPVRYRYRVPITMTPPEF